MDSVNPFQHTSMSSRTCRPAHSLASLHTLLPACTLSCQPAHSLASLHTLKPACTLSSQPAHSLTSLHTLLPACTLSSQPAHSLASLHTLLPACTLSCQPAHSQASLHTLKPACTLSCPSVSCLISRQSFPRRLLQVPFCAFQNEALLKQASVQNTILLSKVRWSALFLLQGSSYRKPTPCFCPSFYLCQFF